MAGENCAKMANPMEGEMGQAHAGTREESG